MLHCTSGKSSDQVELIGCADREHAFESGRIDTFELVRAPSIIISRPFFLCELRSHFQIIPLLPATICAITVSVDNIDGGSTWNLQQIIVTDVSHNSTHTFHNSKPLGIHHPSEILGHRKTRALSTDAGRASFFDFSAANPTTISKTVAPLSGAHTKPDYMGILWVETSKFKLCGSCRSVEHCWERVRQNIAFKAIHHTPTGARCSQGLPPHSLRVPRPRLNAHLGARACSKGAGGSMFIHHIHAPALMQLISGTSQVWNCHLLAQEAAGTPPVRLHHSNILVVGIT